jgi:hypothetical protein
MTKKEIAILKKGVKLIPQGTLDDKQRIKNIHVLTEKMFNTWVKKMWLMKPDHTVISFPYTSEKKRQYFINMLYGKTRRAK